MISFEATGETSRPVIDDEPSNKVSTSDGNDQHVQELERELLYTREHLRTVIDQLESSNEELKSMNEELQSSNEELQRGSDRCYA